ncbi:MAG: MATE family efflux transporter [Clostridia bacterium]|jgi:putative MATE family efflux protein|nr:MATE family efflux transporter [Clostridia bacterium]
MEKIKKNIIKNSIPTIIAFILSDIFTMIDTMLIGSISDETTYVASLSAINVTAKVMLFVSAISRGINVASSTILSRYIANNDKEKMQSTIIHTIILNVFFISLPLVIISLIFMKEIMIFIGNDSIIYDVGKGYYIAIMIGFLFSSFNNILAFLSRSVCEAKRSLYMETFANIFNVVGDIVLINGLFIFPKLGVTGAGVATLTYKVILTVMWIFVLFKSKSKLRINVDYKFKFDKKMIKDILRTGIPASTELLSARGANIIFTKIIAGLGTTYLAAQQICMTIFNLIIEVGNALCVSIAPLVSESIGKQKYETAKIYVRYSRKIAIIISTVIGLLIMILSTPLLNLYTNSETVKSIVKGLLIIIIIAQYAQNIRDIYNGGLIGSGDTKYIAKYTILTDVVLKVILSYICINILKLGLVSIWVIIATQEFLKAIIFYKRFHSDNWKNIKVIDSL